jgi:hypothetical protein
MSALYKEVTCFLREHGYTAAVLEGGFTAASSYFLDRGERTLGEILRHAATRARILKGKHHGRVTDHASRSN